MLKLGTEYSNYKINFVTRISKEKKKLKNCKTTNNLQKTH